MRLIKNDVIINNINKIKKNNEIMWVIKDDAYGFGIDKMLIIAKSCNISRFAVKSIEEGIRVRDLNKDAEILILGKSSDNIQKIIKHRLTPTINDYDDYLLFKKNNIKCHLAIDIGMNRFGMKEGFLAIINDKLITDIYTHLYINDYSKIELIETLASKYQKKVHIGGSITCNKTKGCLRIGRAIYENSLSFIGKIINIKKVKKGESVGYDGLFIADNDILIGICDIGYSNGLNVFFDGRVYINNKYYKCVGKCCMDQCFIVIDNNVKLYDVVEFVGDNIGEEEFILSNKMTKYEFFLNIN